MQLKLTYMLSTNSLSAFSSLATIGPVQQPGPIRQVRDQRDLTAQAPASPVGKQGLPGAAPSGHTPRGSLLNLSV
jgi:hypothetical protein